MLILNNKIFYEFIELDHFKKNKFKRLTLKDVITNKDYVMIVSTNAGLWAYNVGDTIRFTSLKPFRILVTGRVKHFISAFGEHVIGKEVETALNKTLKNTDVKVVEFTVAPQIIPKADYLIMNGSLSLIIYQKALVSFQKNLMILCKKKIYITRI